MKKLMSTIGIVALLVGTSFAQEGEAHAKQEKKGKRQSMLADIPDLTEEQKAQMIEIRKGGRESLKGQHEKIRSVREKLGALNSLIDEMHKLEAEMDKAKTALHLKALSILTPEQRKVFNEKMKKKRAEREKMHKERKQMNEAK
jgi:Spy/CpxP family protein refolding chaperone